MWKRQVQRGAPVKDLPLKKIKREAAATAAPQGMKNNTMV